MPRCKKRRFCRRHDREKIFKPCGRPLDERTIITLALDEFEALRLCDHEHLSQIEAAQHMKISRGTIQRLLESGRHKVVDALLHEHAIKLSNLS